MMHGPTNIHPPPPNYIILMFGTPPDTCPPASGSVGDLFYVTVNTIRYENTVTIWAWFSVEKKRTVIEIMIS